MKTEVFLPFLLFSLASGNFSGGFGPPGKPVLTNCRSPEKETFTCWWRPGSDGGLPTTYALYYLKDNCEALFECPDYHTAGKNSCFFNKNETSVWVNYNITVVATNKMGRTFSDPVDVDVAYIVQPHTPENVTVNVMEDKGWPFLRVSWESPHKADIRSGWITLVYELRSKMEGEEEWEEHLPGQQKTFNIFSVRSGGSYLVKVRCRPDHGFWSEWSPTTKTKIPQYLWKERYLWILILVFSSLIFLIPTWIIYMKSQSLKNYILPPIPGPKIRGFDHQHLKNGSYKVLTLVIPEFPPISSSNYDDRLVEYLEVYVAGEQEVSMEEGKDMQDHYCKSESSTCDSDSGHGSCDSQTLLIDKETNKDKLNSNCKDSGKIIEPEISQNNQDERMLSYQGSPDTCDGRVKTRPSVFIPLQQDTASAILRKSNLERAKQHCLSDTLYPAGSISSNLINQNEAVGTSYLEFSLNNEQQIHTQTSEHIQAPGDENISQKANEIWTPLKSTQYVVVQKVNEDIVLLQPVESSPSHAEDAPHVHEREDYSTVRLVLESGVNVTEVDMGFCDKMETNTLKESCYMLSDNAWRHKNSSMQTTALPMQEDENPLAADGYVDTTTMFSVPIDRSGEISGLFHDTKY
ncbi:prolactin receptor a [Eucyclogobius newberryi]|uniref:prolactin receptor a n=1 Tax=Eucyclogobius newberryi TaxID=166745 RepID=UPI003B5BCFB1